MSVPTAASNSGVEAALTCDMCSKTYQRRAFLFLLQYLNTLDKQTSQRSEAPSVVDETLVGDLMMRHRRRCQGPKRLINRRKACDACVQAKAKCCYTQPACLRCVKRGTQCVYTTLSDAPDQEARTGIINSLNLASANQSLEFDLSGFDFPDSSFPSDFFDTTMTEVPGPFSALGPATVKPSINEPLQLTPSDPLPRQSSAEGDNGSILNAFSLAPSDTARSPSSPTCQIVRVLGGYAPLLTKGSFFSPFVHLSQYPLNGNSEPDLTSFPQTSMAICSSSAINLSTDPQFFRRAMLAARQRLIEDFPSLECMQQWDAVHAMSIYESLELGERIDDESGAWKLRPPIKGLGSPFFLKVRYPFHFLLSSFVGPSFTLFCSC